MTADLKLVEEFIQKKLHSIGQKMQLNEKRREELAEQIRQINCDSIALTNELKEYANILKIIEKI